MSAVVSDLIRDYFSEVMGIFLRHRLASEDDVTSLGERAMALASQWGFLCFAIGVEGFRGNIGEAHIPFYLMACNTPFAVHLLGFLDALEVQKNLKPKRADKLASELNDFLNRAAVFLGNQGMIYHRSVEPKYGSAEDSPLAIELLKIDISKLRASTR